MDVKARFDRVVREFDLLEHPFYRAWSAGTLPRQALVDYAREYGTFVSTLPAAWETLGDRETSQEERDHAELWERFAEGLGTQVGGARVDQVRRLIDVSGRLFQQPAASLGALYAFEVQQPATATSKLEGLRAHYALPEDAHRYFEVHATNHHEAEKLSRQLAALGPADQELALAACREMASAMWDGLTGIHGEEDCEAGGHTTAR